MISTSPFFSSTEQNFSSNHEKCAHRSQIQSVIIITTVDLRGARLVVSVFVVKKTLPLLVKRSLFFKGKTTKGQTEEEEKLHQKKSDETFFLSSSNTNNGEEYAEEEEEEEEERERKDDAREKPLSSSLLLWKRSG